MVFLFLKLFKCFEGKKHLLPDLGIFMLNKERSDKNRLTLTQRASIEIILQLPKHTLKFIRRQQRLIIISINMRLGRTT